MFKMQYFIFILQFQLVKNYIHNEFSTNSADPKDQYIVVLKEHTQNFAGESHLEKIQSYIESKSYGTMNNDQLEDSQIEHVYNPNVINAYSGKFSEDVLNYIKQQPEVKYVEVDGIVELMYEVMNKQSGLIEQEYAPWGLARICNIDSKNDGKYIHDPEGGKDVTVYIIDSGINVDHVEFEGRARWGVSLVPNEEDNDLNGHGTHVAGIVGSKTYGVSKKVNLIAVKVMDQQGRGQQSGILQAIEWVANDVNNNKEYRKASIVNLSIGGRKSLALNDALKNTHNSGIFSVVAAGNSNIDACSVSPASSSYAFTVGATNPNDEKCSFSNQGKCVSMWAPGENILSTYIGSNNATKVLSGTSMASPHAAGAAAYVASRLNITSGVNTIWEYLVWNATRSIVKNLEKSSYNYFLHLV